MHSVELFEWDRDYRIHVTLIGINALLLVSLILRFEWPLIKKRCGSSDENHIETNMKHNEENATRNELNSMNGIYTQSTANVVSVQTASRTLTPQSAKHNMNIPPSNTCSPVPNTAEMDSVTPLKPNVSDIQLTQIHSGRDTQMEEEKYIMPYANDKEKESAEQRVLSKRRKASITFYRELFNVDNFDHNGKLLTTKKREKRRLKAHKKNRNRRKKRIRYHGENDSVNLKAHERPFNDIEAEDHDDIEIAMGDPSHDIDRKTNAIDMTDTHSMYGYESATNIGQILSSKIYDDEDKKAVRFRYRCILYLPAIIFMICGITSLVLTTLLDIELYIYVNYGYPVLEMILSLVLWCQIDIVILSCGGAHIVEECLEVQISANGDEYKCIYCCWCNCAVLRFCNSCTHNNGFSLFKCHHSFMKILICCICPLLTIVCFIISEIPQINEPLMRTTIGDIHSIQFIEIHNSSSVYWLIFMILAILYLVFLFTATYIGILIVQSLQFVSSLSPKTLRMQYVTSVMITFTMQIQFMVLLVYYNVYNDAEGIMIDITTNGLSSPTPFFMLLVYIEFIVAGVMNHFSFRNNDFVLFGREAIEKNEVQLFDFQPDFDCIHDLHNYRRVYGDTFLWQLDHKNVPFLTTSDIVSEEPSNHSRSHDSIKNEKTKTSFITDEQSKKVSKKGKKQKSNKNHEQIESIELEPVIDDEHHAIVNANNKPTLIPIKDEKCAQTISLSGTGTGTGTGTMTPMKETKHNHPTTTTTSLSLEVNGDTIYSLDLDRATSSSHSDENIKNKKKKEGNALSVSKTKTKTKAMIKLQTVDSEKP